MNHTQSPHNWIGESRESGVQRAFSIASIALFLLSIWLPLLAGLFGSEQRISGTELRALAPRPKFEAEWSKIARLPQQIEAWWNDHIGFRDPLIRGLARIEIPLFGLSPSDLLLIGKEGWLFLGESDVIAQYRGLAPLSEIQLDRWQQVLEKRRDWLRRRRIEYLLVLVPEKDLVYPEFMPDRLTRVSTTTPIGQLAERLAKRSDIEVLDLRGPLRRAKRVERVYHKTDTHWNGAGAWIGYREILERLRKLLPALAEAQPAQAHEEHLMSAGMGLANIVGLAGVYREERVEMRLDHPRAQLAKKYRTSYARRQRELLPFAFVVNDHSLPRAVMFRDSFSNALIPYLSEHFERILYVWRRDVEPRTVAVEKPDIVIQEIAARLLSRRPRSIAELDGTPHPR